MNETDLSSHKLPPQNIEAEQSILGGILIENEAINKVIEILTPEDFYRDAHRRIFEALIILSERDEPSDLITLTDELQKKKELDLIGGASYLASLIDSVPTAANIEYYAKIVKEKAVLRKLINASTEIITRSYEYLGDVDSLLDEAEQEIFQISGSKVKPSFTRYGMSSRAALRLSKDCMRKKNLSQAFLRGSKNWID
jgi:replicative DNA helicase